MKTETVRAEIIVDIRAAEWNRAAPDAAALCRRAARAVLTAEGLHEEEAEVSIILADNDLVRTLNRDWRHIDAPTDVLSFGADAPDGADAAAPRLLGDVVIALGAAMADARADAISLGDHLSHLVVHGLFHLLGYDHEADTEAAIMEAKEIAVLSELGIADPYLGRPVSAAAGRH